jgi:hypothetical protein
MSELGLGGVYSDTDSDIRTISKCGVSESGLKARQRVRFGSDMDSDIQTGSHIRTSEWHPNVRMLGTLHFPA